MQFNKLLIFIILINSIPAQSLDAFLKAFNNDEIERQAAYNIAAKEAAEKAAKIQVEADKIKKERAEAFAAAMKAFGYLIYNTGKFSYKMIADPNKTLQRLKNGNEKAITGCICLMMAALGATIYFVSKKTKKQHQEPSARPETEEERQARLYGTPPNQQYFYGQPPQAVNSVVQPEPSAPPAGQNFYDAYERSKGSRLEPNPHLFGYNRNYTA